MFQNTQKKHFAFAFAPSRFPSKFQLFQRPCQLLFLKNFTGISQLCMGSHFHLNLNKVQKFLTSASPASVQCVKGQMRIFLLKWPALQKKNLFHNTLTKKPQQNAASLQCGGKDCRQQHLSWDRLSLLHSPTFFIIVIIINKYHPHHLDHHHYELICGKWLSHISLRGTVMKWNMIYTEGPKNMETPRSTFWRYLGLTHKIIGCQQTKALSLVRSLRSASHNKVIPLWKVADYMMAFLCHQTSPIQYLLSSCFQNRINSTF